MDLTLCPDKPALWEGDTIHVKPTAETTITLAQIEVESIISVLNVTCLGLQVPGVLLIAPSASSLVPRRKEFQKSMKDVRILIQTLVMIPL